MEGAAWTVSSAGLACARTVSARGSASTASATVTRTVLRAYFASGQTDGHGRTHVPSSEHLTRFVSMIMSAKQALTAGMRAPRMSKKTMIHQSSACRTSQSHHNWRSLGKTCQKEVALGTIQLTRTCVTTAFTVSTAWLSQSVSTQPFALKLTK